MESQPKIYLAGAITDARDGEHGNKWRRAIQEMYTGVEWINPLDYESPTQEYTGKDYMLEIVECDLALIEECDAILMFVEPDVMQWGTPQEQFFANGINTPVVVWYKGDPADLSAWCHVHGNNIVPSMEQAVEEAFFMATGYEYSCDTLSTRDPYFVTEEYVEWYNNEVEENEEH